MTVLAHRAPHAHAPLARHGPVTHRAWVAIAMVPVGWLVVLTLVAGHDVAGTAGAVGRVLLGLLALAAPVAAVILSDLAAASGETSTTSSVIASGVLFFLSVVALHGLVLSGTAYLVAVALCTVTLCVALPFARRHPSAAA